MSEYKYDLPFIINESLLIFYTQNYEKKIYIFLTGYKLLYDLSSN